MDPKWYKEYWGLSAQLGNKSKTQNVNDEIHNHYIK